MCVRIEKKLKFIFKGNTYKYTTKGRDSDFQDSNTTCENFKCYKNRAIYKHDQLLYVLPKQ